MKIGLDEIIHLYYEKQWFEQFAKEENIDITTTEQACED